MKAVCIHQENSFDPKVGEVVDINTESFYVTQLWRDGSEIDLEDPKRPGYFKPANEIMSLLKEGDKIEENYCHGMYLVL